MSQHHDRSVYPDAVTLRPAPYPIDLDTGLLTRAEFLQRASAELCRTRRYNHALAVCLITPSRPNVKPEAFNKLAVLVEESARAGIDIAGRIGERQICVLLPETDLLGAMSFVGRLRKARLRSTCVAIPSFSAREAVCLPEETRFAQVLARCV